MVMTEQWRSVVGWEGLYEVSDAGRVRRVGKAAVLTPALRNRYPRVTLSRGNAPSYCTVHVLVAEAFLGPRPEGLEVRHLNGHRDDARASNLAWGTRAENVADAAAHRHLQDRSACTHGHTGRSRCGECHSEAMRAWHARKRSTIG